MKIFLAHFAWGSVFWEQHVVWAVLVLEPHVVLEAGILVQLSLTKYEYFSSQVQVSQQLLLSLMNWSTENLYSLLEVDDGHFGMGGDGLQCDG